MNKSKPLQFGETPFDRMTREELIKTCMIAYNALEANHSQLSKFRDTSTPDIYFSEKGIGGQALDTGAKALRHMRDGQLQADVHHSFFRYASRSLSGNGAYWYRCANPKCQRLTTLPPDKSAFEVDCVSCSGSLIDYDILKQDRSDFMGGRNPINIALDYDGTASTDDEAFKHFAELMRSRGHKVWIVTMRYPSECRSLEGWKPFVDGIFATSRQAKREFMQNQGIKIHVWIDDMPEVIVYAAEQLWPGQVAPEGNIMTPTHTENDPHAAPPMAIK